MLTIAVYFGLRALFGLVRVEGGLAFCLRTLRYGLVGLAAAWGVPWVLIKCRLAQVEKNRFCANRST